jgi:hypothetical protein
MTRTGSILNNFAAKVEPLGEDMKINTLEKTAMPRRERFSISPLGEYYADLLTIDSWINARTNSTQANNLLCSKLQEREERIKARVDYLAKKRGITADEMWFQILKGEAQELSPEEIQLPDNGES